MERYILEDLVIIVQPVDNIHCDVRSSKRARYRARQVLQEV